MKKIILLLFIITFYLPQTDTLHAQQTANIHVELLDGTKCEGKLKLPIKDYAASITFKDSLKKKHVVTGEQLERMELTSDSGDTLRYVAEYVYDKDVFGKAKYKGKRIVRIIYKGEKASLYALNTDIPYTFGTGLISYAVVSYSVLYFKTNDMDSIRQLCYDPTEKIVIGGKKHLKKVFAGYPEIVELIERGDITYRNVAENPISFIKQIEKLIP